MVFSHRSHYVCLGDKLETLQYFPLLRQLQLSQTELIMFGIILTGLFYDHYDTNYDINPSCTTMSLSVQPAQYHPNCKKD